MIKGSIVALVTPMQLTGEVDWNALEALIEWHIEQGTHGIVSVGTTGESATLNPQEHCQVMQRTIEQVAGRIPVIAGTGANSTSEAIELTRQAKQFGADACLLVSPYYNKPTQEGLYLHHKAIAEAVAIPQILYNVPSRTACDMLPETIQRLSQVEHIVGVKEATGDLERGAQVMRLCGPDFPVYSGDDASAVELILMGAAGDISVTANVAPKAMAQMCEVALAGRADEARALHQRLLPLHEKLFVESNPIPVKWALARMGLMPAGLRLPLTPLSAAYHGELDAALKQTDCIAVV